jgi:Flp pilus assembly protein TadG
MKLFSSYPIRSLRREIEGTASIEFAFVGTLLIALTFASFEMGRITFTYHRLSTASGVAARLVGMGATDPEIQEAIRARFPLSQRGDVQVLVTPDEIDGRQYMRVESQIDIRLMSPTFGIFPRNEFPVRIVQLVPVV